jgi:hypothetical protein
MEMILGKLLYYKQQIPIPEIQELCNIAMELEKAKRKVERRIKYPPLDSETFVAMQSLAERLIFKIGGVLRKIAKDEKYVEPVIKDLRSDLEFNEFDKKKLQDEIREQPFNFPMVSIYIIRVEKILYTYLLDILENVVSIKREGMIREFYMSAYNLRGLTPSPAMLKELKEEEKTK